MPAIETPSLRPSLVTFVGGPCHGAFEVGGGKSDAHIAAALAFEKYRAKTPGIGSRFWGGICHGEPLAENYIIATANVVDGRLEIVCQYDGDEES